MQFSRRVNQTPLSKLAFRFKGAAAELAERSAKPTLDGSEDRRHFAAAAMGGATRPFVSGTLMPQASRTGRVALRGRTLRARWLVRWKRGCATLSDCAREVTRRRRARCNVEPNLLDRLITLFQGAVLSTAR